MKWVINVALALLTWTVVGVFVWMTWEPLKGLFQ